VKIKAYLVLGRVRGVPRARRVTQRRPFLDSDEALIRLELDIPDDVFEAPLLTVPIDKRDVAVGVEPLAPLEE
jgi:hypothetical protein